MKKIFIFITLLLSASWGLAREYCNVRFNYCVNVPEPLQWMPEADSGDGRHFKLPSSQVQILVFGSHTPMVFDLSDTDYLAEKKSDYHKNTTVTYEAGKEKSYTVSGYDKDGRIYYHIIKINNGTEAQLHFNYPADEKDKIDTIVTAMADSFVLHQK